METKIIFNGKTYTKLEDMPEEVRQAYQQALAQFVDADKNGIPDILERGGAGNVIAIQQSSINFNGREYKSTGEMPAIVRRLFEMAMGQADANRLGWNR
jgi:acyl CoA:acetate/3-ketoacid CoA transferase alpha subunit